MMEPFFPLIDETSWRELEENAAAQIEFAYYRIFFFPPIIKKW